MADHTITLDQRGLAEQQLQAGVEFTVQIDTNNRTVAYTVFHLAGDSPVYLTEGRTAVVRDPSMRFVTPNMAEDFTVESPQAEPVIVHLICQSAATISVAVGSRP